MSEDDPDLVNRLICEFSDLQEIWESRPETFDWAPLQELARRGAHAYNEGRGPSFHALALDGVDHREFHERFLLYLLQAGFDPFRLARPGTGVAHVPVIDHSSLAESAFSNPWSARMRAILMEIASARFAPLAEEASKSGRISDEAYELVDACAESIPLDMLERIAPELARSHPGETRQEDINPVEGYLSPAEVIIESGHAPYG
ncbi:MAG TPA: hypothetical protein VEC35_20685 [Noviherbaspirillum sp.]|nr:hypothetical protein [Noviherbaspirillum sp.]